MSARSFGVLATLAIALGVAVGVGTGCARSGADDGECACASEGAVDAPLVAFLSKARAAHHEADLADEAGDSKRAVASLQRVVEGPRPGGAHPSPEVVEVLQDTFARIADERSTAGDFEFALRDVEAGLALSSAVTHFRGHLFEVRGVVHERHAKSLASAGNPAASEKAKAAALESYERAVEVQDEVIGRALGGLDAGRD
jgi:hypothetical protein